MVVAALLVDGVFALLGLSPTGPRPGRADIFGSVQVNYKLVLNVIGIAVFAVLLWLTQRRGVTDPVCGMRVDRDKAVTRPDGPGTAYFCSEGCAERWEREQVGGGHAMRSHAHPHPQ
jgi:YHS domain-containing protein